MIRAAAAFLLLLSLAACESSDIGRGALETVKAACRNGAVGNCSSNDR